ncbi:MAG: dihydropteroate synthase [Gammaproteobacteria bacterium]
MAVLNVTPDSFSDGGRFTSATKASEQALQMICEGAAIIDVGGESTRPGAKPVSVNEEIDRVIPVIELLATEISVPISIDTRKPEVMTAAIAAGAGFVNDITALSDPTSRQVVADSGVPVCLMHMQGEPGTMQETPVYGDVLTDIVQYFSDRIALCESSGIARENILIDPGFGFGKTDAHNLELLARLDEFATLNAPLLVGLSRKSMIGRLLDLDVNQRLVPSVVLAFFAIERGANIVRVHDVKETCQAIQLLQLVQQARKRM